MSPGAYARWSSLDAYGMFALFGVIILFNEEFTDVMVGALDRTTDVIRCWWSVKLLPWESAPEGYRVVFSTRSAASATGPSARSTSGC